MDKGLKPLDKKIPVPLYYQLKTNLLAAINEGIYQPGECIPTEVELSQSMQISRSTVRQAIAELAQEGWLDRKTSKGTFVCKPEKNTTYIRSFEPFYRQVAKMGKTPRTELIELSVIEANAKLAAELGIAAEERVISMFRRRYADNEPMVTIRNFLPWSLCGFVINADFRVESLYEVMKRDPVSCPCRTKTIVSAERATAEDVRLLNIKIEDPVLCSHTISQNEKGDIVDYAYSHYRSDSNKFELDASPEK